MLILDLCARAPLLVKCTRPFLRTGSQEPRPANNRCKLFPPDLPFSEYQIIRVSFVNAVPNELFKPKQFLLGRVLDEIPGVGGLHFQVTVLYIGTIAKPSVCYISYIEDFTRAVAIPKSCARRVCDQ